MVLTRHYQSPFSFCSMATSRKMLETWNFFTHLSQVLQKLLIWSAEMAFSNYWKELAASTLMLVWFDLSIKHGSCNLVQCKSIWQFWNLYSVQKWCILAPAFFRIFLFLLQQALSSTESINLHTTWDGICFLNWTNKNRNKNKHLLKRTVSLCWQSWAHCTKWRWVLETLWCFH